MDLFTQKIGKGQTYKNSGLLSLKILVDSRRKVQIGAPMRMRTNLQY